MSSERDLEQYIAGWKAGCHEMMTEAMKVVARMRQQSSGAADPLAAWWAQYFEIRGELEKLKDGMTR